MPGPTMSEGDFVAMFKTLGPNRMARQTGLSYRGIMMRRASIERRSGHQIAVPDRPRPGPPSTRVAREHPGRVQHHIENGVILVGGDGHYWPGPASTAHRAFVKFCREQRPAIVIMNGDVFDGATISRHPKIGWEEKPAVIQELEACQERLHEIELAAPKAKLVWPLGNHDARLETRLATVCPEFARIHGFHLKDHFSPRWEPCWSCFVNDDIVVKHKPPKGGVHATHNSPLYSGRTTVTNHLHSLKVTPFTDYNGTRFGVDCGTLADPWGPQFLDYTEDGPRNHRAGFAVLTFRDGVMLWPEVVSVVDERSVQFRGEIIKV